MTKKAIIKVDLIEMLKKDDEDFRVVAVKLLEKGKYPQAVDTLITVMLNDKDERVCDLVIQALGEIKEPKAIAPLIEMIEKGHGFFARRTLKKIGKPAELLLIKALQNKNQGIHLAAAELLGSIGGSKTVEPMLKILQDFKNWENWPLCQRISMALGDIGDIQIITPFEQILITYRKNPDCFPYFDETSVYFHNVIRIAIISALAKVGNANTYQMLVKYIREEKRFKYKEEHDDVAGILKSYQKKLLGFVVS